MTSWLKSAAALLVVTLACLINPALAQVPVPAAGYRVTDLTQTLSVGQTEALANELERIEQSTGAHVLVLLTPTLDGEPIEDYAQRVFDAWKPGRKGVDDGVLVVLAKHERRMRIAVGRGLEGAIPDLAAKRITQASMMPAFKQERFVDGFMAAARDLETLIQAEQREAAARAVPRSDVPTAAKASPVSAGGAFVGLTLAILAALAGGYFLKTHRERMAREQREKAARNAWAAQRAEAAKAKAAAAPATASVPIRGLAPSRPSMSTAPARTTSSRAVSRGTTSSTVRPDDDTPAYFYTAISTCSSDSSSSSGSSNDYASSSGGGDSSGGGAGDSY